MLHHGTLEAVPPGSIDPKIWKERAIEWLTGELRPDIEGHRVLIATFNDSAYYGLVRKDDSEFIERYQIDGDQIVAAPLDTPHERGDIWVGVQSLHDAVQALADTGQVIPIRAPRQYSGAALYALPQ